MSKYLISFLKDFGLIYLGSFAFVCLRYIIISDKNPLYSWYIPAFESLYFTLICYFTFAISMRLFKSRFIFFYMSWLMVFMLLWFDIYGAKTINLTQRILGLYVYQAGDITGFGVLFRILDPIGIMAITASYLAITPLILRLSEGRNNRP